MNTRFKLHVGAYYVRLLVMGNHPSIDFTKLYGINPLEEVYNTSTINTQKGEDEK